jgi:hypothetical protein
MQVTLEPSANGTENNWTKFGGGASKWENCKDDVDTTGVNSGNVNHTQTFAMDDLPNSAAGSVIDTHTIRLYASRDVAGALNIKTRCYYNAVGEDGAVQAVTGIYPNHDWYTEVDETVPGGGTWSYAIVNATEIGGTTGGAGGAGEDCIMAEVEWVVDYTPNAGGFSYLVASWVGWMAPLCGAMQSFYTMEQLHEIFQNLNPKHWPNYRLEQEAILNAL